MRDKQKGLTSFVGVDEVRVGIGFIHVPHNAPNGQVVHIHLIPVQVFDGINESCQLLLVQIKAAELRLCDRILVVHVQAGELQFHSLQRFSQCLVVMIDLLLLPGTEWQREVGIRLLPDMCGKVSRRSATGRE